MIPSSARFSSINKKNAQSELVKLKYPKEFFVYQDDPMVPTILQQKHFTTKARNSEIKTKSS